MDPNVTLTHLRRLAIEILANEEHYPDNALEIAAQFQDLDAWLQKGGFLPIVWKGCLCQACQLRRQKRPAECLEWGNDR